MLSSDLSNSLLGLGKADPFLAHDHGVSIARYVTGMAPVNTLVCVVTGARVPVSVELAPDCPPAPVPD
jgi:hypothetical protein